jgi:anti-sigma factor RsiW
MKCPIDGRENAALLEYVAGTLDTQSAAKLEQHLEVCPTCAEFALDQRAVWQALDAWESAPVPADFDRRLYSRIEQRTSLWDRLFAPVFRHAMPVAAAAGVLILAGLMLDRPVQRAPHAPMVSAQVETLEPEEVAVALEDMQMLQEFNSLVHAGTAAPRM